MRAYQVIIVLLLVLFCAIGCRHSTVRAQHDPAVENADLFLSIEWCGPESRPVQKVAFVSQNQTNALRRWLSEETDQGTAGESRHLEAAQPRSRHGAVLSDEECLRLLKLLKGSFFNSQRISKMPTVDDFNAQYVIHEVSRGVVSYFPLGHDAKASQAVIQLRDCLSNMNRDFLSPVIQFVQW